MNHQSVNIDQWLGIIVEHEGEIYGRASSWPTINQLVDLVGVENQGPRLKRVRASTLQIAEIELSNKERAY
jgi:hypothetical protein